MRKLLLGLISVAALFTAASAAGAADTLKIGFVNAFSGQFADPASQMDSGIKLYMKQHGDTVAGKKIEIIRKDVGGINPPLTKRADPRADRARQRRHSHRLFALAECLCRGGRYRASQEIHGDHERRNLGHHHTFAVRDPRFHDHSAADRHLGRLGRQAPASRAPTSWSPTMRRATMPKSAFTKAFKAAGGKIVGTGAHARGQSGFLRLCAAGQGPQSGIDLRIHPRRHAAGGACQSLCRTRHRPEESILTTGEMVDEKPLESMGDAAHRHRLRLALRSQSRLQNEQGLRQGV